MLSQLLASGADAFILFLPAMLANAAPFVLAKMVGEDKPLNEKLFGSRTLGGMLAMVAVAGIAGFAMGMEWKGIALGCGAFLGTLANSALKRRMNIPRGKGLVVADQIDFALGAAIVYGLDYGIGLEVALAGIIVCAAMHVATNEAAKILWKEGKKADEVQD